jgi:hypothetical protein
MDSETLKLSVNQNKSGTGRPWERQFLRFQITEEEEIAIAAKGIEGYKAKVRSLWDARQNLTPANSWLNNGRNIVWDGGTTSDLQTFVRISKE